MKKLVASNYDKPVGVINLRIDMCLVLDFAVFLVSFVVLRILLCESMSLANPDKATGSNQTKFHWRSEPLEQCIPWSTGYFRMTIIIIYLRRSSILSILASVLKPLGSKLVLEAL